MTGPEHYREAERLIAAGEYDETGEDVLHARDIALAQVHATLALAAATAELDAYGMADGSATGRTEKRGRAWSEAIGASL